MIYHSKDLSERKFAENVLLKGEEKCKELVKGIYNGIIIEHQEQDLEQLLYTMTFKYNGRTIKAEYKLEDKDINSKVEVVKIFNDKLEVINFEQGVEISLVINYLEEKYDIDLIHFNPDEKDSRIITIDSEANMIKTVFYSGDSMIRANFNKDNPKVLNIFERNIQSIYLD